MKAALAEQLLLAVLKIDDLQELTAIREKIETLTALKFDSYEGYSAGVRFMESLATWLSGFREEDRRAALDFVLDRLTFVSATELDHLVSSVYPDILRPWLTDRAAAARGDSRWSRVAVASSSEFESLQRQMLVVGMSDGARLDKLRRSGPFSNEQFHPVAAIDQDKAVAMIRSLSTVMEERSWAGPHAFNSVVVIDDFAGSGQTMLRKENGAWVGRLPKIRSQLERLRELELVTDDVSVLAVLYLVTDKAALHLRDAMIEAGFEEPRWQVRWVHRFPPSFPLDVERDAAVRDLCHRYFSESWQDQYTGTGGDLTFGYGASALPLILHHNAPNNAPPIIWKVAEPEISDGSAGWRGVFPRHERHHPRRA
ncbi:phosphoribosyltransferase-like protein [Microbacterium lacticum]